MKDKFQVKLLVGDTEQKNDVQSGATHNKGKNLRFPSFIIALVLILGGLGLFCSCGKADISSYKEQEITVKGLKDSDFTVTPQELMEMKCVSRQDTGKTAKAGTVKAYGPLLSTFLEEYGCTLEEIDRVRFYCKDDYKVVLKDEYLTDYEIILSAAAGKEPLAEKEQPLRILVPEAESSKWAYGITEIEFERKI